ncbi:helix-turn-helix domain-containing protein [Treponema sp.]|uniref:helix-turn-helix domain-containing protein n=1 Tax=Treponema sp. TaxID=166 RepID=UPI003EFD7949
MSFKDNVRYLMECKNIQIKELSAKTGISENTIKSYLKENSAEPTLTKAVKIAKALDVNLSFLTDEKKDNQNRAHITLLSLIKNFSDTEINILIGTAQAIKKNRLNKQ